MSNVQREILTRGGSYPGMPPNLGRFWTPGPEEQARLMILHQLNAAPATSAGTAAHDVDDQTTDDYASLIGLPSNTGGSAPVSQPQTSDGLDAAALQRERLRAIQNGDINGYNSLLQQHGQQIHERKGDPGASGFYPGKKPCQPRSV